MSIIKRPSTLTFLVSLLLVIAAIISYFGITTVPLIGGREFYVLLIGHIVLFLGCIMRGM